MMIPRGGVWESLLILKITECLAETWEKGFSRYTEAKPLFNSPCITCLREIGSFPFKKATWLRLLVLGYMVQSMNTCCSSMKLRLTFHGLQGPSFVCSGFFMDFLQPPHFLFWNHSQDFQRVLKLYFLSFGCLKPPQVCPWMPVLTRGTAWWLSDGHQHAKLIFLLQLTRKSMWQSLTVAFEFLCPSHVGPFSR